MEKVKFKINVNVFVPRTHDMTLSSVMALVLFFYDISAPLLFSLQAGNLGLCLFEIFTP